MKNQFTILEGDCRQTLRTLPDGFVHCCVTSPPYWGLRDYGHGEQIGLETTPEAYVAEMVVVFREVRRVLREDGTCWLNLGDTIKDKQLQGIPWRVAFALQADGWWLRQDIVWSKPNPMPESVTDRCTKSHEYIFLLAKSDRYFYDAEAVKEKGTFEPGHRRRAFTSPRATAMGREPSGNEKDGWVTESGFRNRRSVWHIATRPYSGAHFATFPPALITPCVLAGTSAKGCCSKCGAPWERVVETDGMVQHHWAPGTQDKIEIAQGQHGATSVMKTGCIATKKTIGWQPTCNCNADITPCIVLDPFNGAGTTGVVSRDHGRRYIGCELNPEYAELSRRRWAGLAPEEPDEETDEDGVRQGVLF